MQKREYAIENDAFYSLRRQRSSKYGIFRTFAANPALHLSSSRYHDLKGDLDG
jgi:hypothetical protein